MLDSARKNREALVGIGKSKTAIATVGQSWETLGKAAGIKNGAQMKRKNGSMLDNNTVAKRLLRRRRSSANKEKPEKEKTEC